MARKGDGEPGVKTIWLGLQRVIDFAAGVQFMRDEELLQRCVQWNGVNPRRCLNPHIRLADCGRAAALQMLAMPLGIAVLCALHRIPHPTAKCTSYPQTGPYRLVHSARVGSAIKQTTVLNLDHFELPQAQCPALAQRIDEWVRGQRSCWAPTTW